MLSIVVSVSVVCVGKLLCMDYKSLQQDVHNAVAHLRTAYCHVSSSKAWRKLVALVATANMALALRGSQCENACTCVIVCIMD